MKRKWLLAGGAAVVVAVAALGVGGVLAQSEEDGQGRTFLDRVAEKLGIETGTLEQAIKDARTDQIDEALAAGDITEQQAERLRQRVENQDFDGPPFGLGRPWGGPHAVVACGHGVGVSLLRAADGGLAEFLGMTPEELQQALAEDGATLATVAEAQGKSRGEVKGFLLQNAQERLSEAVADGDITQTQADRCLEAMDQAVERLLDAEFHMGLKFDRGFRWRERLYDGESGEPDDESGATPQGARVPALSAS